MKLLRQLYILHLFCFGNVKKDYQVIEETIKKYIEEQYEKERLEENSDDISVKLWDEKNF